MSFEYADLGRFPRPQTSLVGRNAETDAIHELLVRPAVRLVTLTGPGGIGKTRLALHAALTAPGFSDGRWFIELAGIAEPSLILPRIAQVLDLRERSADSLHDQIVQALDGRDALIVLDNFEHLLDGALVLSQLLAQTRGPKLLITSRAPLNLAQEFLVPVPPLDVTQPGTKDGVSDATALFLQRTRAIRPGYQPGPAELEAIAAICAELSGLPLAIELAAARTRVMAPQALLARLSQPLRLLAAGPTDAPERHRSMRDAIEWSYRLLPAEQRAMLRAMGIFAGSVPLDGIEFVAAAAGIADAAGTIELIDRLADASMVDVLDTGPGEARFLLFATVREFVALEMAQSGELTQMRDHHAAWVDWLTALHEPDALSEKERLVFARMRLDLDNIRAALGWSLEQGDLARVARILGNLWSFWAFGGQASEGRRWVDRALPIWSEGVLDPADEWKLFHAAGLVAWAQANAHLATERHQQAHAIALCAGDAAGQATSLHWLSQAAWYEGNYERMIDLARQAIRFDEHGPADAVGSYALLGVAAMRLGRLDEAERELDMALAQQTTYAHTRGIIWVLQLQADLYLQQGKMTEAIRAHRQSLPFTLQADDRWAIFESLSGLLTIALQAGRTTAALELLACAELLLTSADVLPREGTWLSEVDRAQLKSILQPDDLQRLADYAASLSLAQVVALADRVAASLESGDEQPRSIPPEQKPASAFALSPREQDVLGLMVKGLSDREIADTLFISHGTARTHVGHVLHKLDARNRAVAVRKALELELV